MASANIAKDDSLTQITNLLGMLTGKTQTSTTSSNVSAEGVNALIQQILGGTQGLAAVSSGQKSAGLYNSSVNQQLVNDLITRTSGEVAKQAAGSTTVTKTAGALQNPTGNLLSTAMLLKSVAGSKLGKQLIQKVTDGATGVLTGTTPAASATAADVAGGLDPAFGSSTIYDAIVGKSSAEALGSLGAELFGEAGLAGTLGAAGESAIAAAVSGADLAAASAAIPELTAAGAGLVEGAGAVATAGEAAGLGELIATLIAWVVCTELNKQGRLPNKFYVYGAKKFATYKEQELRGYYIWAIPAVKHLRAKPNSWFSNLLEKVFYARAEYIAAEAGCSHARKTMFGGFVTAATFALCWTIGAFVPKKDWKVLYARA